MVSGIPRNNVSTEKDEWCTPMDLYQKLDDEFHFDLDAACTPDNCLNRNQYGFSKADDALSHDWVGHWMMDNGEYAGTFFLNPPYGRGKIKEFVKKAYLEEIRILGRVKYIGFAADRTLIKNSPTFDSCIVVFKPGYHEAKLTVFKW